MKKLYSLFVNILILLPSIVFSQDQVDTNSVKQYLNKVDSIDEFIFSYYSFTSSLQNLNPIFCQINIKESSKNEKLIELYLRPHPIHNSISNKFFKDNYSCFTVTQRDHITSVLNTALQPSDPFFHELVSLYKLDFVDFLQAHIDSLISKKIMSELKMNGKLSERIKFNLRNMATLANLNNQQIENSLVDDINGIYNQVKLSNNISWLSRFYSEVLPNSIAIINSRNSVIKTLYLMDETANSEYGEGAQLSFAQKYFFGIIEPKLKDDNIVISALSDFDGSKAEIKRRVMTDEEIWLDYIR